MTWLRDTLAAPGADGGVLGAMMSGSGPTVFAAVESEAVAQQLRGETARAIPDRDLELWVTRTIPTGIDARLS